MNGQFGVYAGTTLLAEFDSDEAADEYRRELLEENIPEAYRRPVYSPQDLEVRELPEEPEEYALLSLMLTGLRASVRADKEGEKDDPARV